MKSMISPKLPSGFRDYLPEDMIPRQDMLDTIRRTFERFGFVPLDTPGMERLEVLTGGDENFKKQLYKAGLEVGEEDLGMRFDLTVPLARVVSLYGDKIVRPFKRYQMGKVWRGEKPQAGRFREFIQFDVDIVGSERMSADAEIVALMYETMTALNIPRFTIRINNRKILNALADYLGYDRSINPEVLRTIDKLDKIQWEGVAKELAGKCSFDEDKLGKLKAFLELRGAPSEILITLGNIMKDSKEALEGITELTAISTSLKALGVPESVWCIDLSVARGLGYYTGPVFETVLEDLPSIGSVFSGGRYDDLVSRFGERSVSATGASVGVDRLFAAMEKLGLVKKEKTVTKVMVLNFDETSLGYSESVVTAIRRAGISAELYLGKENNIKGQLAYALNQDVPVIVIAGSTEMGRRVVQIKDTVRREQIEVAFDDVVDNIKKVIGSM